MATQKRARKRKRRQPRKPTATAPQTQDTSRDAAASKASRRDRPGARKRSAARGLRRLEETFRELRFEPKGSGRELLSVLMLSFGALALGAGIYAQWFWRAAEPPGYAPILIGGGVLLIIAYAFSAPSGIDALIVGDLGIGTEEEGRIERFAWYELETLQFAHNAVVFKTAGKPVLVPLKDHGDAARHIVAEALARLPDRVEIAEEDVARIGQPVASAGEAIDAEPPQVTDHVCRATEQPLHIEKDVRMCAQCGVFYHRKGVPNRCAECARRLKRA